MAIRLVFNPRMGWSGEAKSKPVTYREMEILVMSAEGYSHREIAESLGVKYQTVKNNLYKLGKKLGAENSAHALLLAMEAGMIQIEMIHPALDPDLSPEMRERARIETMREIEKVDKMSEEERERYFEEHTLGRRQRRRK